MKKCGLGILVAILLGSLSAEAQIERSTDFHSRYTLKEAVVLSRHNIRSPLSGRSGFFLAANISSGVYRWNSKKARIIPCTGTTVSGPIPVLC